MSLRKPNNWYDMSFHEQNEWQKTARAVEDAEYERDQIKEDLEREQAQCAKKRREAAQQAEYERAENADRLESLADELADARRELALRNEWLKIKGLATEFDDWASYRRME